ncbi:hypothetical protein ACFL6I_19650 [candidate division KSB1 bacterium]
MDDLLSKAQRLKELDKLVIKSTLELNIECLGKYVDEYRERKKEIRTALVEYSLINIPGIRDKYTREIL